jgi:hypothetical protein
MAEIYEKRLETELSANPLNSSEMSAFDVYRIEILGRIKAFTEAVSKVMDGPYRSEVLSRFSQYLQSGVPYKNPEAIDIAMQKLKDSMMEHDNQERMKDYLLTFFKNRTIEETVVENFQKLSRRAPLFLSTKTFYWTFSIPYALSTQDSEVTLAAKILDEMSNPLIDFHDYLLSSSYTKTNVVEKAKSLAKMAEGYLKEIDATAPDSRFLDSLKLFLHGLSGTPSWYSETDKRLIFISYPMSHFGALEVDDGTVNMLRELFEVSMTDNEVELIREVLHSERKDFVQELLGIIKMNDKKTRISLIESFSSYASYNQLAENLGIPKVSLEEISQSLYDRLAHIFSEKYRTFITKESVLQLLRENEPLTLYFNGQLKKPESSYKPAWENPNISRRISLPDFNNSIVSLKEELDTKAIIGKAVRLTKKPRLFYHKNRENLEKIKSGEIKSSELKNLLANLRTDLSETDRLHLVEGEFLSLTGRLDDNNVLRMAGISARDNKSLFLKYWERNFELDSVSAQGYNCCLRSDDIARYIENPNASIYEAWHNGYRLGGIFLLNTTVNKSPSFFIDSIECHPRLFSMLSDRFGWDYTTSVNNVIKGIVKCVGLESISNNRKLVIASNSNVKEIEAVLTEIGKNSGHDIIGFDKKNIMTDVKFESLPKEIDLSKI